jgi:hypothetical protein
LPPKSQGNPPRCAVHLMRHLPIGYEFVHLPFRLPGEHHLLRDRDASYGSAFRNRVQAMGIKEVVTAPRAPWQNPYVERLIGSIRRECLDHIEVFSISSQDQNASFARQGLSAASPHTTSFCRRDNRVPRGARLASSLRTSRRMTVGGQRTAHPCRRDDPLHFPQLCSMPWPRKFHSFAPLANSQRVDHHMHNLQQRSSTVQFPSPITFLSKDRLY